MSKAFRPSIKVGPSALPGLISCVVLRVLTVASDAVFLQEKKMSGELTQFRLKELLHYDPETGVFTWKVDAKGGRVKAGQRAGHLAACGYLTIRVEGKLRRGARLAHLYMIGRWPDEVVDHRNGLRSDDRWANLRPCTQAQNTENIPIRPLLGASLHRQSGLWRARHADINIGYFKTADDAHQAYLEHRAKVLRFNPTPRTT